jgi:2,3-dihydroxyphenylpropionate 1,2-dioxygenase
VASELSLALVRYMQRHGFDPAFSANAGIDYAFAIPMDYCGMSGPVIPVFVNAYVPPQPAMERCYAFGQTLADGVRALGARAVVVTSGGLSHYPGTERYVDPGPDTEFDRRFMERMAAGETRYLLSLGERRLDETGNIELRCWGVAFGMIGDRAPDSTEFLPTWHHNYGTVAWTREPDEHAFAPHYPHIRADRVVLSETLHRLAADKTERNRYLADPAAYVASVDGLSERERAALVSLDRGEMIALGVHPFVPHAFRRVLERMGILEPPVPGNQ